MKPVLQSISNKPLTDKQILFIQNYIANGFNGTQACIDAGYQTKDPGKYGSELLSRPEIQREVQERIKAMESARIASATEVLQFYTSVMRGEILDQFGIEASLDTRLKAANELAKHQIELPMKLEAKSNNNNLGSITLNFIPRNRELSNENA